VSKPNADIAKLADMIKKVPFLVSEMPIEEMNLNTVIVFDSQCAVADARIKIPFNREK